MTRPGFLPIVKFPDDLPGGVMPDPVTVFPVLAPSRAGKRSPDARSPMSLTIKETVSKFDRKLTAGICGYAAGAIIAIARSRELHR